MKKIKSVNGYSIYEATKRDENKYNVTEGCFYIYFSSDIRDYGLQNSDYDFEAGSVQEAEDFCNGSNYAIAKEIVEERTTAATYEEIAEVEKALDNGATFEEYLESEEWIDTEIVIAGAEMPDSFVWDGDNSFTEEGKKEYAEILNAKYTVTEEYIEVFCDNEELGRDFVLTVAGYTPESRYNRLIMEN